MEQNKFKIYYDTQAWQLLGEISSILEQNFGIEIKSLSNDDDETQEYEIIKKEN